MYDLVIRVRKMTVDDAADVICHTAQLETFKTTFESRKAMEDLVLASEAKTALIGLKPDIQVIVRDGVLTVGAGDKIMKNPDLVQEIERIAGRIPGVKGVNVKSSRLDESSD